MKPRNRLAALALLIVAALAPRPIRAADGPLSDAEVERRVKAVEARGVAWRRDLHEHPELGNSETRTAGIVADHLKALGLQVRTGVARTGVVGVLQGGRPGKVVALRADMDALPVTEKLDLPFASKVRTTWNGQEVGVMHACGHDAHVAMLMGVAEVLAGMRAEIPGTVLLLFQPAEEGGPPGEVSGAELMIKEGALSSPKPDAVFGLHVFPMATGTLHYRPGGIMAAGDTVKIVVRGRQTHGAMPWAGVDPIVVASQIVLGLQTIASRQVNITESPLIVTIGRITGGVRSNIIPDQVELEGTIRTFDERVREDVQRRVRQTAEGIARSAGAVADVTVTPGYPVTNNDPSLTERMAPTLRRVAGDANVRLAAPTTTSEDFSYYQKVAPGLFFFLGVTPPGQDPDRAAANHSPRFFVYEAALSTGVRALTQLALDFLRQ